MPPKKFVLPGILPTLKADLQNLCKRARRDQGGTVAELRKRLQDSVESESEEEDLAEQEKAANDDDTLSTMTKQSLVTLAKDLGIESAGSKAEIVKRILDEQAKVPARCRSTKTKDDGGKDDGWQKALDARGTIDLKLIPLSWSAGPVLLEPVLWVIMFSRHPVAVEEIHGPYGTDGTLLRSLRERWRRMLPHATETDLGTMCRGFGMLHSLLRGHKGTPENFCELFWPVITEVTKLPVSLQVKKLDSLGLGKIASRVHAQMAAPANEFGASIGPIIAKAIVKSDVSVLDGPAKDTTNDPQRRKGNKGTQRRVRGVCRRCGAKASKPYAEFFQKHNKTCKVEKA